MLNSFLIIFVFLGMYHRVVEREERRRSQLYCVLVTRHLDPDPLHQSSGSVLGNRITKKNTEKLT